MAVVLKRPGNNGQAAEGQVIGDQAVLVQEGEVRKPVVADDPTYPFMMRINSCKSAMLLLLGEQRNRLTMSGRLSSQECAQVCTDFAGLEREIEELFAGFPEVAHKHASVLAKWNNR